MKQQVDTFCETNVLKKKERRKVVIAAVWDKEEDKRLLKDFSANMTKLKFIRI